MSKSTVIVLDEGRRAWATQENRRPLVQGIREALDLHKDMAAVAAKQHHVITSVEWAFLANLFEDWVVQVTDISEAPGFITARIDAADTSVATFYGVSLNSLRRKIQVMPPFTAWWLVRVAQIRGGR